MSDFAGLRLALSSLMAQRRGVETAAQNVANANTPGYSRQRVDLQSQGAPAVPALWSVFKGSSAGVRVAALERFRNQFLEIQAGLEHGSMAQLAQGASTMRNLEGIFPEPSDAGIARRLTDFWTAFDDVANHPDDTAARTQLLERASTLTASINAASDDLTRARYDTITELQSTVTEINALASSIASLNRAIKSNQIAGISANELMDQRDLLVTQLAEASGGAVRSGEYGQVNVVISGTAIVSGEEVRSLMVDSAGPVALRWVADSSLAAVTSGKVAGQLEAVNATIPGYVAQLDAMATALRDDVNSLHGSVGGSLAVASQNQGAAGNLEFELALDGGAYATVTVAGADWSGPGGAAALGAALQAAVDAAIGAGNATVGASGGNGAALAVSLAPTATHTVLVRASGTNAGFATLLGTTAVGSDGVGGRAFFSGSGAGDLEVASGVAGTPAAIAAGVASAGPLDGSRALDIADLAGSTGGADALYRQMIVQLGVGTQTAATREEIQQRAVESLDNARQAESGVSLDEEMTNLVQFQHAYDAAARFLAAIDEMLDTLINRTAV